LVVILRGNSEADASYSATFLDSQANTLMRFTINVGIYAM
jgi:hypothetical protein